MQPEEFWNKVEQTSKKTKLKLDAFKKPEDDFCEADNIVRLAKAQMLKDFKNWINEDNEKQKIQKYWENLFPNSTITVRKKHDHE